MPMCHGVRAGAMSRMELLGSVITISALLDVSRQPPSHPAIVQPSKSIIHVNYPKTKLFHPSIPSFKETHSLTSKNDTTEY